MFPENVYDPVERGDDYEEENYSNVIDFCTIHNNDATGGRSFG